MARNILKASFLLSVVPLTFSTNDQILCSKSNTLFEIPGDAVLIVFVDANYGQYCNISSSKGIEQIWTALRVIQILNENDHVPGWQLGLRIFDTCQDRIETFEQMLEVTVRQNCAPDYGVGIILPSSYDSMLDPFRDYGALPIITYKERNYTEPTIEILTHYLSTRYETVDLVLASTDYALNHFLRVARDAGVCVKRDGYVNGTDAETEAVIVAIGETGDIQRWLRDGEESQNPRKTWFMLPLDHSDIDDLIPVGSYIIRPEVFGFDRALPIADEFLKNSDLSVNRSPYLLGIGKAIVGLTKILWDIRKRNCPADDDNDDESCIASQFRRESRQEIRDSDVYDALHVQPRSHTMRYVVTMKTQRDVVDVALYGIETSTFRVVPEKMLPGMPGLCLKNLAGNCENCANFQRRDVAHVVTKDVVDGNAILKSGAYVLVLLIAIACGTFVCCVIAIFIVYRFATEETLHGNPVLTIVLILANVFTLLTALPFCMADDYFGAESLNSRKILLTTLAFAFTFSIMLSRTIFLALTMDDVLMAHINGYLESLVIFLMFGVQVAASFMYFILDTTDSAMVVRSTVFLALLGYDIFLLVSLFVASCFVIQIQRNYREGKCFFGTAIGLLTIWSVWLICFVLMRPEYRDVIVSLGTIGTAYMIILGVLIPRIYYMAKRSLRRKNHRRKFDAVDLPLDSTVSTIIEQSRFFCGYIPSAPENRVLQIPLSYPNYYGSPSASSIHLDRCTIQREVPEYNNYGFHAEMKEIETAHDTLPTCTESLRSPKASSDVIYTQPEVHRAQRIVLEEKDDAEVACNRDNLSPTVELRDEMYLMRYTSPTSVRRERRIDDEDEKDEEQDQEDESVSRITRF